MARVSSYRNASPAPSTATMTLSSSLFVVLTLPCAAAPVGLGGSGGDAKTDELPSVELEQGTLREAVESSEWWAKLRWRYEHRDDAARSEREEDGSLSTVIGLRTAAWGALRGLVEFTNVSQLGPDDEALVVKGSEINRLQLEWQASEEQLLVLGRQRIRRGNGRWVCERPWRMMEQNYDAATYAAKVAGVDWYAGLIDNINTGLFEDKDLNAVLLDAQGSVAPGAKWMAYLYDLDYPEGPSISKEVDAFESSTTVGLALTGKSGGERFVRWRAEVAQQTASHNNDSGLDELYAHAELYAHRGPWHAGLGYEVFGGDGTNAVQFTLGRRHGLNGFTNRTARIPGEGLEEKLLEVGYDGGDWDLKALYRVFDAENAGLHYGDEFNLAFATDLSEDTMLGIRYASYVGDEAPADRANLADDVQRFWIWVATGF